MSEEYWIRQRLLGEMDMEELFRPWPMDRLGVDGDEFDEA